MVETTTYNWTAWAVKSRFVNTGQLVAAQSVNPESDGANHVYGSNVNTRSSWSMRQWTWILWDIWVEEMLASEISLGRVGLEGLDGCTKVKVRA